MSSPGPLPPDAGPWGDRRDREALRAAVASAESGTSGGPLWFLVVLALIGLAGTLMLLLATHWMGQVGGGARAVVSAVAPARPTAKAMPTMPGGTTIPPPPSVAAPPATAGKAEVKP